MGLTFGSNLFLLSLKCEPCEPLPFCNRFHEVRALRALVHAARALCENGDDFINS